MSKLGRLVLSLQPDEEIAIEGPDGGARIRYIHKSGRRIKVEVDAPKSWRIDRVPPPDAEGRGPCRRA